MGYPLHLLNQPGVIDPMFKCGICNLVVKDPLFLPCRPNLTHIFCSTCINGWLKKSNKCPIDGRPAAGVKKPDYEYLNLLNVMAIRCPFISKGCNYQTNVGDIVEHLDKCEFNPEKKKKEEQEDKDWTKEQLKATQEKLQLVEVELHGAKAELASKEKELHLAKENLATKEKELQKMRETCKAAKELLSKVAAGQEQEPKDSPSEAGAADSSQSSGGDSDCDLFPFADPSDAVGVPGIGDRCTFLRGRLGGQSGVVQDIEKGDPFTTAKVMMDSGYIKYCFLNDLVKIWWGKKDAADQKPEKSPPGAAGAGGSGDVRTEGALAVGNKCKFLRGSLAGQSGVVRDVSKMDIVVKMDDSGDVKLFLLEDLAKLI